MTLVVDASVAVKWFVAEDGSEKADALLGSGERFIAPDLILFEIGSVLWRRWRAGELGRQQVQETQAALPRWFAEVCPLSLLYKQAMDLTLNLDHHIYDCAYLALAVQTSCELITADNKLRLKAQAAGLPRVRTL